MTRILCAAIHYKDGKKHEHQPKNVKSGLVIGGFRHCQCLMVMYGLLGLGNYDKELIDQGFLTSTGRYVGRVEGLRIALRAKQVIGTIYGDKLYSENLY